MIISALGNRLFYTSDLFVTPVAVIESCSKNKCDGLFSFDRKHKIMRYYDCDGVQNYCGNAIRSLPLVLGVDEISFSVKVKNELIPAFSWKDERGLYATEIKIRKFKELKAGFLYWAFVGNYQEIRISSRKEFELARENASRLAKLEKKRPPNYSFVLVEGDSRAKVRVIEDFGDETASCCTSASAVTKVMSKLYPQIREFELEYPGGTFFTCQQDVGTTSLVTVKGKCEILVRDNSCRPSVHRSMHSANVEER